MFKPFDPEVLRSKVGVFVDLYEKSTRLAESEERFRAAFTNAPIGIGLIDPDGCWLQVNRRSATSSAAARANWWARSSAACWPRATARRRASDMAQHAGRRQTRLHDRAPVPALGRLHRRRARVGLPRARRGGRAAQLHRPGARHDRAQGGRARARRARRGAGRARRGRGGRRHDPQAPDDHRRRAAPPVPRRPAARAARPDLRHPRSRGRRDRPAGPDRQHAGDRGDLRLRADRRAGLPRRARRGLHRRGSPRRASPP